MTQVGKEALPRMLMVTMDLFRLKSGGRVSQEDESYQETIDKLMTALKAFEKHTTVVNIKDYHSAVVDFRSSMNSFLNDDFTGGLASLDRAAYCAKVAFRQVGHYADKMLLSRIQTLYALHEHQAFVDQGCHSASLQTKCRAIFNDLCQTPEVIDAIHHELEKHSIFHIMTKSHARTEVYRTILEDVHCLNQFFGRRIGTKFLIYGSGNKLMDWKSMKPLKLARSGTSEHPIQCIAALGDELYTANNKGLNIWKIRAHELLFTFEIDSVDEIKCMIEHNSQLITGSYHGGIRIWDLLNLGRYQSMQVMSGVICMKVIGGKLYVASHNHKIQCFDLETYSPLESYECDHECLDFTLIGGTLYISALTNELHLWDIATQVKTDQIEVPCNNIMLIHEIRLFGVDTYRTSVTIYDLVHCCVTHTLEETAISLYVWGNTLVVENSSICLWDLTTFGKVRVIETKDGVKDVVINDNRLFYSDGSFVRIYLM